jgi:hypothetical protein
MNISRGALRTIGFVCGGLLALGLALSVGSRMIASNAWTERVTAAVAEARARDPRRPVLWGEAVPGRAWDQYEQALAAIRSVAVDDVRRWLDGAAADRAKAGAVLAAHRKALDLLRAGARKAQGGYPVDWWKGASADAPSLIAVRDLTTLTAGQARVLLEDGKPREAGALLLDAAQFGADLGRNATIITEMIGLSSLGQVFDGLRELPPDPEVGAALAVLDATFPNHGEGLMNQLALMGVTFRELSFADVSFNATGSAGTLAPGWRFGFSQRMMLADAWPTLEDMMRRLAATTSASWVEAQSVAAAIAAEATSSDNQIVKDIVPGLTEVLRAPREARARLRMLRVLHGGAVALDDPFGGKLLSDGVKVWSVGADGIDNGGTGAWKPVLMGDIVLELPAGQ